jgi:hypothetical protein
MDRLAHKASKKAQETHFPYTLVSLLDEAGKPKERRAWKYVFSPCLPLIQNRMLTDVNRFVDVGSKYLNKRDAARREKARQRKPSWRRRMLTAQRVRGGVVSK